MELKTFISSALLSVVNGVKEANSEIDCFELTGSVHSRKDVDGAKVDFDLSVVVEQLNEKDADKGAGLKIQVLNANISKKEKETQKNQSTQKIQSVFINDQKIKK